MIELSGLVIFSVSLGDFRSPLIMKPLFGYYFIITILEKLLGMDPRGFLL